MAKRKKIKKVWLYLDDPSKRIWALNFLSKSETQYVSARILWLDGYHWESSFFMMQALENLLKALYIQTTKSKVGLNCRNGDFKFTIKNGLPSATQIYSHSLNPLVNEIATTIKGFKRSIGVKFRFPDKKNFSTIMPKYFEKYQQGARYPQKKYLSLPFDLLKIFDEMFSKLRHHFNFANDEEKLGSPIQTLTEDIANPDAPSEFFREYMKLGDTTKLFEKNQFFKASPNYP